MDALSNIRAVSHRVTWLVGKTWPRLVPLTFVLGYPKSGTTWICQLLSDFLRIPFPQHSIFPIGCRAVVHGHEVVTPAYPRVVYVVRDGRDALTSFYFHIVREMVGTRPRREHRRALPNFRDKHDVRANITPFIRANLSRPLSAPRNWGDHVTASLAARNPRMVLLKYEDLIGPDRHGAFARAMEQLEGAPPDPERVAATLTKYSFEKVAGRSAGNEDRSKFVRKGQAGDWANHFTREAAELFDRHCGDTLIRLGYEKDHSWVEQCR